MGSPTAEGQRVVGGRYRLVSKVGSGGMGTVWRAHDELLGRTVAVKEVDLPPQLASRDRAELRERTMREARAAARLNHPNAVTVHDVIEQDGQPWIVMALVPAHSLAEVIATSGPLPPRRVAEIGLAVLDALDAAHRAGILHRDVKPANVLLGYDGRVVLTDFGVATLEGDPALTGTGMLLGSPAYIAPERALGLAVGRASDLWSLGATLYAAVEGRPPYDRSTPMATLAALATEEPQRPRTAGPLASVLDGLLQRDPQGRLDIPTARRLLQAAAAGGDAGKAARVAGAGAVPAWEPIDDRPTAEWTRGSAPPAPDVLDSWASTTAMAPPVARPRSRRRQLQLRAALVGGIAVTVAGAVVAAALITDSIYRERTTASRGQRQASPPRATVTATASPVPTVSPLPAVPAGFGRYYDTAGWSVGKPAGWRPVFAPGGQEQQFSEDFAGLHLYVYTQTPPLQAPLSLHQQHDQNLQGGNYRRIFLGAVAYRGYVAADFEYTADPAGPATTRHVRSRIFRVGSKQYDITLDLPAERWNLRYFTVATDTFQPQA